MATTYQHQHNAFTNPSSPENNNNNNSAEYEYALSDSSLDPIQDIFQQFEQQQQLHQSEDAYASSSHSYSGGSDMGDPMLGSSIGAGGGAGGGGGAGDYSYDSELLPFDTGLGDFMGSYPGTMGAHDQYALAASTTGATVGSGSVGSALSSASSPGYGYPTSANGGQHSLSHSTHPYGGGVSMYDDQNQIQQHDRSNPNLFPASMSGHGTYPSSNVTTTAARTYPMSTPTTNNGSSTTRHHHTPSTLSSTSNTTLNFHPASSLSPPSSSSSPSFNVHGQFIPSPPPSNSTALGNGSFVHNETLARMIAEAQAKGQYISQSQQQQQLPQQQQLQQQHHLQQSPPHHAQQQQHVQMPVDRERERQQQAQQIAQAAYTAAYLANSGAGGVNPSSTFDITTFFPNGASPISSAASASSPEGDAQSSNAKGVMSRRVAGTMAVGGGATKKRRLAPAPSNGPLPAISRASISGSVPAPTIGNSGSRRKLSHGQPAANFDFAFGNATASVELIANAGIGSGGKLYRDALPANKVAIGRTSATSGRPTPISLAPAPGTAPTVTPIALGKSGKAAVAAGAGGKKKGGVAVSLGEKVGVVEKEKDIKKKKNEKGHNAVERRYRNNINNAIATLRDIVPALRHLKPLPSMPASRRRASQFTLSTAAQAPTPSGLIDGIPAAKTLSKGTILGKAIEYIQFLQGARIDANEDVEIFKAVVLEMVAGGGALIEEFERKRAEREAEREVRRAKERAEQALLDEEDEDEDGVEAGEEDAGSHEEVEDVKMEEEDGVVPPPPAQHPHSTSHLNGLAQLRQNLHNQQPGACQTEFDYQQVSPNGLPPSPISSSDEQLHISPKHLVGAQFRQHLPHRAAPPRVLLAAFMGLSFAGGLGYDWTYGMVEEVGDISGSAWAGALSRRAIARASVTGEPGNVSPVTWLAGNAAVSTGLVFLGLASILATITFILYPLFSPSPSAASYVNANTEEEVGSGSQTRSQYRQRRRADALATLAQINANASAQQVPTYVDECKSALKARKELLRLVGAPTYGLLPALAKEALATALRNVTTIRVGSFSTWAEEDRVEAAVAWVRIAEIETLIGADEINYLARCYTFLRLFNLSRSTHWPSSASSISRPAVNAVLALHLNSLGQPLSAHALWNKATNGDRKKSDVALDPWVEIALSTDFEQARTIVMASKNNSDFPCPSDTVPLLKVSEACCEGALKETWAKIFLAVVQTTCPPHAPLSGIARFATIVDQPLLEETVAHVIASTAPGASVHTLARITQALCVFYTGATDQAQQMARGLAEEARANGPMARLACAAPFFTLLLDESDIVSDLTPESDVDILATTTLGWLTVRRHSQQLLSYGPTETPKADPALHAQTLAVRRLLGSPVFADSALIAVCASPAGTLDPVDLDLESAQDACLDALTDITRRAAGLKKEDDSGVELDSE